MRLSYQPSQVWLTMTEPSADALAPTPMGVQAIDAAAEKSRAALAKAAAEKRFISIPNDLLENCLPFAGI